ncbi:MAG: hypothetical protein ACRD2L_16740 [Terriglobia bacterium]
MTNKLNGGLRSKLFLALAIASAALLSGCNEEMRDLVNKARLNRGLRSLKRCENELNLGLAALGAADKSAKEGLLLPPDLTEAKKNANFRCFLSIAARGRDTQAIHDFLMSKDEFRSIFLSNAYRWVGTGEAKQNGGLSYASYIFAGDKDSCPLLNSANSLNRLNDSSFASNGVEEAVARQETISQPANTSETTTVCCANADQLDGNQILNLSPELLEPGLRDSKQAFRFLLSNDRSSRNRLTESSSEQVGGAEELIRQLAEKHPALKDELLKAWDEFKLSERSQETYSRRGRGNPRD